MNKYKYYSVIQQNYGQGWEDVSHYETNSKYINTQKSGKFSTNSKGKTYEMSLISHDLKEYHFTGYATRLINRKELNTI
jgi:hypothetical protein